ncbi:unnamed protein product [Triticum turgidum subsp. durum]|uniref:Uncharacterized protein n=1 Tax=Triticum turgidum subsp. durum TaxID=4567 RepID=A0A9R0Z7S0_TRITD|nr:unnamed protein product [Triticum turgidum subsp. durum]
MGSPSAPPALLLSFLALPYGSSSRRSLFLNSKQRLQRLPSPGTGRRHVAAAAVDKLAPRPPEAGRLRWKYRLACRGSYDSGNGLPGPPPPPPSGESVDGWRPALRRWDVPWQWPTVSLTMVACALRQRSFGRKG